MKNDSSAKEGCTLRGRREHETKQYTSSFVLNAFCVSSNFLVGQWIPVQSLCRRDDQDGVAPRLRVVEVTRHIHHSVILVSAFLNDAREKGRQEN